MEELRKLEPIIILSSRMIEQAEIIRLQELKFDMSDVDIIENVLCDRIMDNDSRAEMAENLRREQEVAEAERLAGEPNDNPETMTDWGKDKHEAQKTEKS